MLRQTSKIIPRQMARSLSTYSKQSQIFIHPKQNNKNLISFSKSPDSLPIGEFFSKDPDHEEITPETFISSNSEFVDLLHKTIQYNIADDFTYAVESGSYAEEHMPVYDLRKIPNYQRQPEVEDIFGFVRVDKDGTVLGDTYQKNDLYRLVTVDGPIKLSDHIHEKLVGELM